MGYPGLLGLSFELSETLGYKPISGLYGVVLELEANLPVKVQDSQGRGIPDCEVVASNPSGTPSTGHTDSLGNVLLNVNAANPNPVTVTKNKIFKTSNYTGGNSFTIILDPVWDE